MGQPLWLPLLKGKWYYSLRDKPASSSPWRNRWASGGFWGSWRAIAAQGARSEEPPRALAETPMISSTYKSFRSTEFRETRTTTGLAEEVQRWISADLSLGISNTSEVKNQAFYIFL